MGKKDFDEFIKKQRAKADEEREINWSMKRDEWLTCLDQLYKKILSMMKKYTESGDVSVEYREKAINEEWIGEYKAKIMILKFKGNEVSFDPIGTILIGAKGRVDLKGSAGTVKFVLVNKQSVGLREKAAIHVSGGSKTEPKEQEPEKIEWDWKIATPPPRIKYIELNEESFFDALMEVING
ncbi:MAG: hypothetical protein A2Z25_18970 [Planctomycetes bacterium RBG_16_55_9]|nr:MAG: hypothetical protein A2Z25_18970 [Planctomycetes bacterium RBG_16_55_9]